VTTAEGALTSTTFNGPTVAIKAPQNIKLAVVTCSTSVGGCETGAKDIEAAAKLLHWNVQIFNGNSDPTTQNDLIQQAVNTGFQAIIIDSIDPSQVQAGLTAAHKKHIPVGSYFAGVPPSPTGVAYDTGADWTTAGKALGAFVVVNSKGKANLLPFEDKEFQSQVDLIDAVTAEVKTCSTCTVQSTQQFIQTDVAPKLGVRVVNLLQKNPSINYVDMGYDPAASVVVPSIKQASLDGKVSVIAANGAEQNLNWIKTGEVQTGDLIVSFDYAGWAAVDQMARLLLHKPLIKDPSISNPAYAYGEGTPTSIVSASNLSSVKTDAAGTIPFGIDAQLAQDYGKLWGVSP
jgi:ribose transport system substrate-binding protein